MEVQGEQRSSGTGGLLLIIALCVGGFLLSGGKFPVLSGSLVNSSSCNQLASGYAARTWALEACQDATAEGIPERYFTRQIYQESGFDPNVVSSSGDVGIAQFQPATARGLGIDPMEPHGALRGAAHLMGEYYQQYGDYAKALGAYNAGEGTLKSKMRLCGGAWQSCMPPVTQRYINIIMG